MSWLAQHTLVKTAGFIADHFKINPLSVLESTDDEWLVLVAAYLAATSADPK